MSNLSGNGSSKNRLIFNGDEGYYELWETKFSAHLHLKDLGDVIDVDSPDAANNKKVFAELFLLLDDVSLSLVMWDAKDDFLIQETIKMLTSISNFLFVGNTLIIIRTHCQ